MYNNLKKILEHWLLQALPNFGAKKEAWRPMFPNSVYYIGDHGLLSYIGVAVGFGDATASSNHGIRVKHQVEQCTDSICYRYCAVLVVFLGNLIVPGSVQSTS